MNELRRAHKLLSAILWDFCEHLGGRMCDHMPNRWEEILSQEEWDQLHKYYHEQNGDPEEFVPGRRMQASTAVAAIAWISEEVADG